MWKIASFALVALLSFAAGPDRVSAQGEGGDGSDATASAGEVVDPMASEPPEDTEPNAPASVPSPAETAQAADEEPSGGSGGQSDMQEYAAQLRLRQEVAGIHRAFGIATWGAMLVTVALGAIQYHNQYGGFGGREETPCVRGDAVFGQEQCWGIPWPHRISALTTTALYSTTFVLSFMMPDPDNLSEGSSDYAQRLQLHKTLRWIHLGGMLAQIFLGFATAQDWFGTDRANDFDTQRALASVHMGIGLATFGVLTAAGAIMIF